MPCSASLSAMMKSPRCSPQLLSWAALCMAALLEADAQGMSLFLQLKVRPNGCLWGRSRLVDLTAGQLCCDHLFAFAM